MRRAKLQCKDLPTTHEGEVCSTKGELVLGKLHTCGMVIITKKTLCEIAGKKIPPTGWKCERCELKEGLWLNLTDGAILCGRKFWDGTGGNEHAKEHYEATKYPLVVKLGTITPDGAGRY